MLGLVAALATSAIPRLAPDRGRQVAVLHHPMDHPQFIQVTRREMTAQDHCPSRARDLAARHHQRRSPVNAAPT